MQIKVVTTRFCPFCIRAKELLDMEDLDYTEVAVDGDRELRNQESNKAGGWPTVPMIWIGDTFVGGYTELSELHRSGKLTELVGRD